MDRWMEGQTDRWNGWMVASRKRDKRLGGRKKVRWKEYKERQYI